MGEIRYLVAAASAGSPRTPTTTLEQPPGSAPRAAPDHTREAAAVSSADAAGQRAHAPDARLALAAFLFLGDGGRSIWIGSGVGRIRATAFLDIRRPDDRT
jgi:hypothetical protein